MADPQVAPYGSWKSPVTSDLIVSGTIRLGEILLDGEDVYWIEMRPEEEGRNIIVRRTPDGRTTDVTPPPFNARTRVHEYGGGAFVAHEGTVYFSNFSDQRLYCQAHDAQPQPITTEANMRYADGVLDHRTNRLICVREDHSEQGEAVNSLVSLDLNGDSDGGRVIVSGNDFYCSPRLSPDGSKLAWLTWNHPNMPWDGTGLWIGEVEADGSIGQMEQVAGGENESIFQPEWSPDGILYFVSDRSGWWNLYRLQGGEVESLVEMEAEFGEPQWVLRMSAYAFESSDRIICTYTEGGASRLAILDPTTRKLETIDTPYSEIGGLQAAPGRALFIAGSPTQPPSLVQFDLASFRGETIA